ncbi:MAG: aminopeptidase P family protein [Lachnospiraceae bacterium]|nr:aminopeptidase P family protein [Lachnospiraceae bacterium]
MSRWTIEKLRGYMKEAGVDAWMVNSSDFHDSEYPGDYFKQRSFLSGFTGSAGTLVVTAEEAGLWTDGRYFVQAAHQLEGSGITLYKMGQKDVPTVAEFLADRLPENGCLGFDGRTVGQEYYLELKKALEEKHVRFSLMEDLGDKVWEDRPALSCEKVWILDAEKYSGMTAADKIEKVRESMKKAGATVHLLTSLDDIAWLFNIRGGDVECNPVALSYAAVTMTEAVLFVQEAALDREVREALEAQGITIQPYNDIYNYTASIGASETVMLESSRVNCAIYAKLPETVKVIDQMNPETVMKAVKNPVEQENIVKAHVKDGVAMVKFLYWLKQNIGKIPMTELSAAAYLDKKRSEQEGFLDLSFETISAYGSNAAMCHYSATEETDTELKPEGFLLVDSGGQYMEGTTDITRTIVLGPITEKQKLHYTLVLKGMIDLASAHFIYGCIGASMDILTRGPLWQYGLDYNHGTGHGVGYLLNVHEGPQRIHWNARGGAKAVIEPGMLTSDEPGMYLEGEYGIRTENLVICKEAANNEYGRFLEFETVTLAPIDKEAIDISLMTPDEIDWLNRYHEKVYTVLSPYLEKEEADWLKDACSRI